jgi:hypothetical protein
VGPFFTAAVTIVFAIMLLLLPFIADHLVSLNFGAVGEAVMGAVRTAAGIAVAGAAGAGAGGGAVAGKAAGAAASGGAGFGSVATGGAGLSPPPATSAGASVSGGSRVSPPPASGGGIGGFVAGALKGVGRAALGRDGSFVAEGRRGPPKPSSPPPATSTQTDD